MKLLKTFFRLTAALALVFFLTVLITFFIVTMPPEHPPEDPLVVNDVSTLNPTAVSAIAVPETTEEIAELVKNHTGIVSIGGARHSMGGQIASEKSLHLDMRRFDNVISFSSEKRTLTVQAGITWRKIQEYIDPHELSIAVMQTYANFTVGGSLSVNVHGRYVGMGPIIHSVESVKVILADGRTVIASRVENPEIFYACIGGYGGLGVIVEATIRLTGNSKVERSSVTMPVADYKQYFMENVRNDSTAIFHNGDLYPDDYNEVRAITYRTTHKSVTNVHRLKPPDESYRMERFGMWMVSELPFGKWVRRYWGDPLYYDADVVRWRNYEASYDADELEPSSRKTSTYVLLEYFVPVDRFDHFVSTMAAILRRSNANIINVSIRHAYADNGSLLAWAKTEVFCFVIYYKQGVSQTEKDKVKEWTRELVDAALFEGGSFYLPYQVHATKKQFLEAYPRAQEFFNLKKKLDPENKFRNKLWDNYY
ncbi:MAG TPA: FAD-binding oxidoreductase [Ohtaekwangia sp.]|nr:FAD-binding oxidoreductase [Ohtaekwangia sp.]